jgi:hypothetical protein
MRIFIVLSLAMAAIAQTNSRSDVIGGVIGPSPASVVSISSIGPGLSTIGPGLPGGAATGEPYSGEEVTERVQTLADGNPTLKKPCSTAIRRDAHESSALFRCRSAHPVLPHPISSKFLTP